MTRVNRHFFDGPLDGSGQCAACGKPYEQADERHDYGKLFRLDPDDLTATPAIRPFVKADEIRERAELAIQASAIANRQARIRRGRA